MQSTSLKSKSSTHCTDSKALKPAETTKENSALKKMKEEKCDDETELIDLDLGIFSSDTESVEADKREKDHPALYYTVTLNWEDNQ